MIHAWIGNLISVSRYNESLFFFLVSFPPAVIPCMQSSGRKQPNLAYIHFPCLK